MNLLIITNALARGGAEKLIETTIPLFQKKGIEVTLLLLNKSASVPEYVKTIESNGVPIIDLNASSYYQPSLVRKIRRIIDEKYFKIIHVHLFPSLYWVSLAYRVSRSARKGSKLVYTEHSNQNKRRKIFLFKHVDKFIYKLFHQIIAITDEVKKNLGNWIGNHHKIITITNGVDLKLIDTAAPIERITFCNDLNIPEHSRLLLMAASFRYPKDHKTVVSACKPEESWHVLFAGEGPLKSEIQEYAYQLGISDRVHFLGFRTDIAPLMKSVDINILSSSYEGLSGVTLEALASGIPFLGSNVEGIKDVVPDQRYLFEKGNYADLAKKIREILENKEIRTSVVTRGLEHVQHYDIQYMVDKYIHLYHKLLQGD